MHLFQGVSTIKSVFLNYAPRRLTVVRCISLVFVLYQIPYTSMASSQGAMFKEEEPATLSACQIQCWAEKC